MAPSEKQPFYDPIPPTYDEALATSSRQYDIWPPPRSSVDDTEANETEAQSLLNRSNGAASSSVRPGGYRQPTVESDNSDVESLLGSDTDDDEAAQVRREIQEMDIEEPSSGRGSLWGKRIGFSLPSWRWSWRPSLPRIPIPRVRIRLPAQPATTEGGGDGSGADTEQSSEQTAQRAQWRWNMPKIDGMVAVIVMARLFAVGSVFLFLYLLFASDLFGTIGDRIGGGFRFNAEDLRVHILNTVDPRQMRYDVKHFSRYAHIAGSEGDFATAMDIEAMFGRVGLDEVRLDKYIAYINYPRKDGRAVEIMDGSGKEVIWSAKLDEDEHGEETAGHQTYAFHGHSKSGDVKGPLIYANYGSRDDFKKLKDSGVKTDGAIALVRYYGTQSDRALKVKAAELAGFAGCIIYSDPADDGFVKGPTAPDGPYMPKDGVQRGSVSLMSWVVGDVLTPGWASNEGMPRMKVDEAPGLVGIPSLPLAWRDAQILLQKLEGHGSKVPESWEGGVPDIKEWWTGDEKSPIVRLKNEQDENTKQPIWNVYGKIVGMEQSSKSIIIGNHRDSWAFGATDPHTGTAILLEMTRIFGDLVLRGWRPLRTIEFMSWDAEEYNLIGSTEFVENNLEDLRDGAYAYINLDTAVSGTEFRASGSPVLQKTLLHALGRIEDPNLNATLKDLWEQRGSQLEGLGAGSDYVAFQDIAGTSSIDVEFSGGDYPYHSSYDDFELVENVIDPGFTYHGLMAQVVGLMILDLADRAILPFDMEAYGRALEVWVGDLEQWAKDKSDKGVKLEFNELHSAVADVQKEAAAFSKWEDEWNHAVMQSAGWEGGDVGSSRLKFNHIMARFDTILLDLEQGGGIPNRTQFKHVVFGPQLWSGYDEAFFPAIRDCIDAKEWDMAKRFIAKTSAILRKAARSLTMEDNGDDEDNDGKDKDTRR